MTSPLLTDPLVLSCLFLSFIVLLAAQRWYHWRRRCHRLSVKFRKKEEEWLRLEEEHRCLLEQSQRDAAFSVDLSHAEMTTRLQQPRLNMHGNDALASIPERYRYAQRLSESGMSAEQVSELLSLSPHEARQVVRLVKLGSHG